MNQQGKEISDQLPPYKGTKEVLVDDHNTNDIISYLVKIHPECAPEYDKVAELHWQGNANDTARHLFDFCKKNIRYKVEGPDDQTIKKPAAILAQGYGDCKHYASYIVGVCDSLRRKGYPISGLYRFTADRPGMTVHHVFAVVKDPDGGEYWTDPVIKVFNKRPSYHNIKDKQIMGLSLISGTGVGDTDAEIGAKHKNVFKQLAHGIKVSEQNAAKGIKTAAQKVEHVLVQVAGSPARNSFLALVDFNMFNTAKHLHNTLLGPKRGALLNEWSKLGGTQQKLINAVNNGIRNYNKNHAAKISMVSGGDIEKAAAHYINNIYPWHHRHLPHTTRRRRNSDKGGGVDTGSGNRGGFKYLLRGTDMGVYDGEFANQIGVLPAIAPAAIALASGIIAALSKFMDQSAAEKKDMANAAKAGGKDLVKHAAKGIDIANQDGGAEALDNLVKKGAADGGGMPNMNVSTDLAPDGTPQLNVHSVDHPVITKAGTPMSAAADDGPDDGPDGAEANTEGKEITPMPGGKGGFMADITGKLHQFWTDYKTPIEFVGAGILIFKLLGNKSVRKALHIK